ncbi:MAG: ChaN family lipoprotein [Paracoccaceae bacterium]|nr:ChaN family lipoprotein [Paracoccaceae bacterium]
MIQRQLSATLLFGVVTLAAPFSFANGLPSEAGSAQIVFLGEQHDNLAHHTVQAEWAVALAPSALVFEMLTPDQAAAVTPLNRLSEQELSTALNWEDAGWPDFAMYYPIFAAAPTAQIFGAGVPRAQVRQLMEKPLEEAFDVQDAQRFGLDQPLSDAQQAARENLQRLAHCDALPADLLPMMVSVQRLRDAVLARTALEALDETGGPVLVITGNGHARADWGAPFLVAKAAPEITVFALGQGEAGNEPDGVFNVTLDGPTVDRGDPCDAFR